MARQLGAPDCGEGSRFGDNEQDGEILRQEEDDQIRHIKLGGIEEWLDNLRPPLENTDDDDNSSGMSAASFGEVSDAPLARTLSDISFDTTARCGRHGRT